MSAVVLVLSTSSLALSLALFDGPALVAHDHRIIGRGHAEALVPAIAALLGNRRATAIIVDIGPGSFTGIRIGIAAARALGLAWGVPVTGCRAGAVVAAQAFALCPELGAVTVLIDAGRGHVLRQRISADHATGPLATIAVDALEVAGGALEIAVDEATAGTAAPASRGRRIHAGEPDAAFALRLPIAARCLEPVAFYVRPPDAVLPL